MCNFFDSWDIYRDKFDKISIIVFVLSILSISSLLICFISSEAKLYSDAIVTCFRFWWDYRVLLISILILIILTNRIKNNYKLHVDFFRFVFCCFLLLLLWCQNYVTYDRFCFYTDDSMIITFNYSVETKRKHQQHLIKETS